ncbi:MAG: hypothetical protein U0Z26_16715 [Anaerolineales bacterium]
MSILVGWVKKNKWACLFGIWAIQGAFAAGPLLFPLLTSNDISRKYLFLVLVFFTWIFFNAILFLGALKNTHWWNTLLENFFRLASVETVWTISLTILLSMLSVKLFAGVLGRQLILLYGGYLKVLSPLINLTILVSLEIMLIVLFYYSHLWLNSKDGLYRFLRVFGIVFLGLIVFVFIVSFTKLGIEQGYKGDWSRGLPAVPLLEWQIFLAVLIGILILLFESRNNINRYKRFDLLICVFIWFAASSLWLSQPVIPSASALAPHAPNFEIYPFIDSQTYDEFAQLAVIGKGFGENRIPQRPLYIVFLVFLHNLVGQKYDDMIFVQSLVFALFPVLLYLLGKEFFGRPLGGAIAFLAILRDYTSNFVAPFTGNLSYSKLYLSEIPTAMLLVLFLLFGLRWIKLSFPVLSSILLGGILGTAILIRTQVIVALPIILVFGVLVHPAKSKGMLKGALLMVIMIALMVSPWLWRNWRLTGEIMFDSPESQTINLALRYSRLNGVEPDVLPFAGETNAEYNARLKKTTWDAITSNPWGAIRGVLNSFLNHGVNNILVFPLRSEIRSLDELLMPTHAFWEEWEGTPNSTQMTLLVFYIVLFGLGLSVAWWRNGWLGLLPLGLNLIYNLWTSLALLSGQRFMLTMDWSIYLYYMLGVLALVSGFLFLLKGGRVSLLNWFQMNQSASLVPHVERNQILSFVLVVFFLGIGLALPITEKSFVDKYPPLTQGQLLNKLVNSPSLSTGEISCISKIADNGKLKIIQGRAIYPRYYLPGEGEDITDSVGYKKTNEGRLVFDIIGQSNFRVIFPMEYSPEFFPHASDVTLIYDGSLAFILVSKDGTEKLYPSSTFDEIQCKSK